MVSTLLSTLALLSVGAPSAQAATPTCGWLSSVSGSAIQQQSVVMTIPPSFAGADLLVAVTAEDGPDTAPVGGFTTPTTALLGGSSGLHWSRLAHVSARHDVALPGDQLETAGASSTEVWEATVPAGWAGTGRTITEISSHARTLDDGHAALVTAYANGVVSETAIADGLGGAGTAKITRIVPAGSAVYAAVLEGRMNAAYQPRVGSHTAVQRRAGDDTMSVVASNGRALPAGTFTIGHQGDPRPYWEEAMVVVSPRTSSSP